MAKKIAKCLNCNKEVEYYIREDEMTKVTHDGVEYTYTSYTPICNECGEPIWVGEVIDMTVNSKWDAMLEAYERRKDFGGD